MLPQSLEDLVFNTLLATRGLKSHIQYFPMHHCFSADQCVTLVHICIDFHWRIQGVPPEGPPPNGIQFFRFHVRFRQNAPTSEVGAPCPPPTGNPGSATDFNTEKTSGSQEFIELVLRHPV